MDKNELLKRLEKTFSDWMKENNIEEFEDSYIMFMSKKQNQKHECTLKKRSEYK